MTTLAFPFALLICGAMASSHPYGVTYKGRFQSLLDGCQGPSPIVQIACPVTLTLLNVSHPDAIVCTETPPSDLPTGHAAGRTCVGTCTTVECSIQAYGNDGSFTVQDGPWGEIVYQCRGDTADQVDTVFLYRGSEEPGTCAWRMWFDNRIYHVAQLGVLCDRPLPPPHKEETTNATIHWNDTAGMDVVSRVASDADGFVYDDYYFECGRGDSMAVEYQDPNGSGDLCAAGQSCGGEDCTVPIATIEVRADVPRLAESCLDLGDHPPATVSPLPRGDYTVRFQAGGSLLMKNPIYWYDNQDMDCWQSMSPILHFQCDNGHLQVIETDMETMECVTEDNNVLTCYVQIVDWENYGFRNSFYTVTYECTASDQYPTTVATLESNNLTCYEDIYDDLVVGHALQIGHFCGVGGVGEYRYQDYDYECGKDNLYIFLNAETEALGDRFTCLETVVVDEVEQTVVMPSVTMATDWRMEEAQLEPACFYFQPFNTTLVDVQEGMGTSSNISNSSAMP